MTKKQLKEEITIQKRKKFIKIYSDFNDWLQTIGFRNANFDEANTPSDYLYSYYGKYVKNLWGVEHFIHDTLQLSLRFLRDRNKHKFMLVGVLGSTSVVYSLDEFKIIILNEVRTLRDIKLAELNKLTGI